MCLHTWKNIYLRLFETGSIFYVFIFTHTYVLSYPLSFTLVRFDRMIHVSIVFLRLKRYLDENKFSKFFNILRKSWQYGYQMSLKSKWRIKIINWWGALGTFRLVTRSVLLFTIKDTHLEWMKNVNLSIKIYIPFRKGNNGI